MNDKHLSTLELPKILGRLATFASFSAGAELARALRPATGLREVRRRLETTSEARTLLDAKPETSLGGARDHRPRAAHAERGKALPASLARILVKYQTAPLGRRWAATIG